MSKPLEPDVEKLRTKYPNLVSMRGTLIFFDEIAAVLNLTVQSRRLKRVLRIWVEDSLLKQGVWLDLRRGRGAAVYVLTIDEQQKSAQAELSSGKRKIRQALEGLATVDRKHLTREQSDSRDLQLIECALMIAQFRLKPGSNAWNRIELELLERGADSE